MKLYCCACERTVDAQLTNGKECYPHRRDLHSLPFWRCDDCENFVGCHHKSSDPTRPLGCIPTPEVRQARQVVHALLDPLWQSGRFTRAFLYSELSRRLGYQFHIADIRSEAEARETIETIRKIMAGEK